MGTPERILVADDDRAVVRLIQDHFEALGCQVTCAFDGREALAALDAGDFDRVYLDVMMPYVDGFELVNRIRRNPAKKDTWVALMTAQAHHVDEATRKRTGADHLVQEPVEIGDLVP